MIPSRDDIWDLIRAWNRHEFGRGLSLPAALDWTETEYQTWVHTAVAPNRPLPERARTYAGKIMQQGEYHYIILPEAVIAHLNLQEGDRLRWRVIGDGQVCLTKAPKQRNWTSIIALGIGAFGLAVLARDLLGRRRQPMLARRGPKSYNGTVF